MTFKTGKSGNPNGRPKGTGYRQQLFNTLVEPHKEVLFDKAISLAREGNETMLRLFLERMLPPRIIADDLKISMPNIKGKTVTQIVEGILNSLAGQELSITELRQILRVLEDRYEPEQECHERIKGVQEMIERYKRDY